MSWYKAAAARVRSVVRARSSEARMEEEFRFHLEMEIARLIEAGVPPHDAHRRARAAFGGLDRHREEMRDGRGARWFADFISDIRYAFRAMRRSAGFAVAVAVTLGVGIGVNGMTFGYVNSMLFRPVPAGRPDRLVALFGLDTKSGTAHEISYDDYVDFRDRSGAFTGLAGFVELPLNLVAGGGSTAAAPATADLVWAQMVTENFFTVLDMRPALGRLFDAADAPQGANSFAVVSFDSWKRRFHGDSSIVGRTVRINGTPFTVTGIAPRGFKGFRTFGFWSEIWVPVGMHNVLMPGSAQLLEGRGAGSIMTVGRMHDGWDIRRTEREASAFAGQLARTFPATNANTGARLLSAEVGFDSPDGVPPSAVTLVSALGVFGAALTLLIISANLANLQLARSVARGKEIAIRLSLGCSRARLTRQLAAESIVLALPGAVVAVLMLRVGPVLQQFMLPHLQFQVGFDLQTDYRVAAFTAGVSVAAILLFGLVPALRATNPKIAPQMSSVIGAKGRTSKPMRIRGFLVISQLAMSVILIVGGTLFVRSLYVARAADVGFEPRNRLLLSVNVGLQGYDNARGRTFYDHVLARVRELPGVVSATWGFPIPFDTYGRGMSLYVPGAETATKNQTVGTDLTIADDDFVRALGLRLQAGRGFATSDSAAAPQVMIVSRSLAARLWPGKDPVGLRARNGDASGPEVTVVGVVADARFSLIGETSEARAYLPLRQHYRDWQTLVIQTAADPTSALPQVRGILTAADPTLPVFGVTTMEQSVDSGFALSRTAAGIAGFFGLLALLVAAVGLYAVVASSVAERTREIGVRMALGSTPTSVLRLMMRSGARLGAWGLGVGLIGAAFAAQAMRGLLYGLSPVDPLTFALVPILLMLIVLVATWLPARRALKLDPVTALRDE